MAVNATTNAIVHITLPAGLKLVTQAVLAQDITFDIISRLDPFYASIDQLRLELGSYGRLLPQLTLGAMIYQRSVEVNAFCFHPPTASDPQHYASFTMARNRWVTLQSARYLLLNSLDRFGKQTHILANLSVTNDIEIGPKLDILGEELKRFEVTVRSCGLTTPGGFAKAAMGAKGLYDWSEKTPARTWQPTGPGANTQVYLGSPTGGRGKSTNVYAGPFYSAPIISYRFGIFHGTYAMGVAPTPSSIF